VVVDDDAGAAEHLKGMLIASGYDVEIITDGAKAVETAGRFQPELFIISADMEGDPDGIRTALTLRSLYDIPFVFLSGGGIDTARASSAHPYGYIQREFGQDAVRIVVEFALNKRREENAARECEETLNTLLNIPSVGIVLIDRTYAIRSINQMAAGRANRPPGDLIGTSIMGLIGEGVFSGALPGALEECFSGKSVTLTLEIKGQWIEDTLSPIRNSSGDVTGAALYIQDFSRLQKNYQEFLDSVPFGVIIVDTGKGIRFVNREALNLMNRSSPDELIGKKCYNALCPANINQCPILDQSQTLDRSERILVDRFGNHIPILKSVRRFTFFDQPILIESFIDYSDYKRAERLVRESEEKYRTLAESSDDIILIASVQGEILYMNSAGLRYSGKNYGSVIGLNLDTFFSEDMTSHLMEGIALVQKNGPSDFLIHNSEGGKSRWYDIHIRPVPLGDDTDVLLAVARDVTMYQESVISLEENMESLAILNDEIRNPLQVILGTVLLKDSDLAEKIQPFLSEIDGLVKRLDRGWLESKKVHEMLRKHYGLFEGGGDKACRPPSPLHRE
jgi:PAS domain S-box-containing protein